MAQLTGSAQDQAGADGDDQQLLQHFVAVSSSSRRTKSDRDFVSAFRRLLVRLARGDVFLKGDDKRSVGSQFGWTPAASDSERLWQRLFLKIVFHCNHAVAFKRLSFLSRINSEILFYLCYLSTNQ